MQKFKALTYYFIFGFLLLFSLSASAQDVFLKASVDVANPYVGQQVVYTLQLFAAKDITHGILQDPQVPDATVRRLGKDLISEQKIDGRNYKVFTRRYAIFPEHSGIIKIMPAVYVGKVRLAKEPVWYERIFSFGTDSIDTVAPTVELNVKPIPSAQKAIWWAPAKNLTVSAKLAEKNLPFQVDKMADMVVTVKARGLLGEDVPEVYIGPILNAHMIYEHPMVKSIATNGDVIGTWQQRITFIPIRSGKMVLPQINIKWWNTALDKADVTTVPTQTFAVEAAPIVQQNIPIIYSTDKRFSDLRIPNILIKRAHRYWVWILFGSLFLVLLILFILQVLSKRALTKEEWTQLKIEREKALQLARDLVEEAARANDPKQTRNAILKWASLQWPGVKLLSLANIADHIEDKDLAESLENLEKILYTIEHVPFNGTEFLRNFHSARIPQEQEETT